MTANQRPELAVVMATRDRAADLVVSLGALRTQTRPPDRVVVVDDGSTDGTAELLGSLTDAWPELAVVRLARSRGPGAARRVGFALAPAGAVIVKADDHDPLLPDGLAALERPFVERPDTWCVLANHIEHWPTGRQVTRRPPYRPGLLAEACGLVGGVWAVRRELDLAIGGWRIEEHPAGDVAYLLRCEQVLAHAGLAGAGIVISPEPVAVVDRTAPGISSTQSEAQQAAARRYMALARAGGLDVVGSVGSEKWAVTSEQ